MNHTHQWVVVETQPAQPASSDSRALAQKYPMTAICKDPGCREKRILIHAFQIQPGGPGTPIFKVPKEWALMTIKATDEELAAIADMATQELT